VTLESIAAGMGFFCTRRGKCRSLIPPSNRDLPDRRVRFLSYLFSPSCKAQLGQRPYCLTVSAVPPPCPSVVTVFIRGFNMFLSSNRLTRSAVSSCVTTFPPVVRAVTDEFLKPPVCIDFAAIKTKLFIPGFAVPLISCSFAPPPFSSPLPIVPPFK